MHEDQRPGLAIDRALDIHCTAPKSSPVKSRLTETVEADICPATSLATCFMAVRIKPDRAVSAPLESSALALPSCETWSEEWSLMSAGVLIAVC